MCVSLLGASKRMVDGGRFTRVKVTLDISLPLCHGHLLSLENGEKLWVSFKYERLPNLCYCCGRLDHSDRECSLWLNSKGTLTPNQRQYSQSLRAPPYRSHNKPVVFVLGFYETFLNPTSSKVVEGADRLDEEVENSSSSSSVMKSPIMEMDMHDEVINANVVTPN